MNGRKGLIYLSLAIIFVATLTWNAFGLLNEEKAVAYLEDQGAIVRYEHQGILGFFRVHKRPVEVFMTRPVSDVDAFFINLSYLTSVRWFDTNASVDREMYRSHIESLAERGVLVRKH